MKKLILIAALFIGACNSKPQQLEILTTQVLIYDTLPTVNGRFRQVYNVPPEYKVIKNGNKYVVCYYFNDQDEWVYLADPIGNYTPFYFIHEDWATQCSTLKECYDKIQQHINQRNR